VQFLTVIAESIGELAAVQGRILRRSVLATASAVAWIAFATFIAVAGASFALYAVYLEASALSRPSVGALLAALVAFAVAGGAALRATRLRRP
jgi:hypothetical protein